MFVCDLSDGRLRLCYSLVLHRLSYYVGFSLERFSVQDYSKPETKVEDYTCSTISKKKKQKGNRETEIKQVPRLPL